MTDHATVPSAAPVSRASLRAFLARNPFPQPRTLGFFYREKMRAIHQVAPPQVVRRILEVGGGRSGLAAALYPGASVVTIDIDRRLAGQSPDRRAEAAFVCGDATALPFADGTFDLVTFLDVFEHIRDDRAAALEGLRVLCPNGALIASSPNERWRYPYYPILRPIAPTEETLFAEWGHVRRGYSLAEFDALLGSRHERYATFISPGTALCHDVAFSRLPKLLRIAGCAMLAPLTWTAYLAHKPHDDGTETALAWRKP